MAYKDQNLSWAARLGPQSDTVPGNSLYVYKDTATALATLLAANYFDSATHLQAGDIIQVVGSDGITNIEVSANNLAAAGHVVFARVGTRSGAGQITTGSASDTVVTGGLTVAACGATLDDSPVIGCMWVTATIGDQAGTPAAGSILVKTWKPTATNDATPIAATTTGKKVNWWAKITG